jgi:hypothetical protein
MAMRTSIVRSILAVGLLALAAPTLHAQYDPQYNPQPDRPYDQDQARPRDLVALQDDLLILDDNLSALSPRHPRYPEFQRWAEAIRQEVSALADQMRRSGEDRREGTGVGRAEVAALRTRIAILRDDVEIARSQRQGREGDVFVVPAGTDIQVMLDREVSSRSSNLEDHVLASTVAAIRLNDLTLVPAGASVAGVVSEVRSKDRGQKDDYLKLDFDSLTPEGGRRVEMRSHVVAVSELRSGSHTARNTGIGAVLGAVLGGLIDGKKGALIGAVVGAGGGLLASQGGDKVELPEGTLITLRLDEPLTLERRAPATWQAQR